MNKTAIKNFAIWARNKLIADVSYDARLIGITEDGIAKPLPQSFGGTQFFDIGTAEPYSISGEAVRQRDKLIEVIQQKEKDTDYKTAYQYVIEEVAYTWFNRLIAIRFMEVNDYLPSHIRVLSSESGKLEPDLATTPFDAELPFTAEEEAQIFQLKQDNKLDEVFRILFLKQCNALNEILPALFEKTKNYTELLLSLSVIDQDGVVYHLIHDIPEDDFNIERGGQVEIIGWLYQYYNTEPKAAAFAKNGKITKEEIPAVTQLFTPDWIVRYMVENSLGRLWVEGHPECDLKENWKYYLEEAQQEPEVQVKLAEIRKEYAALNPEDIKLIDPCMGSGHILVYAFDVLMQIYESAGYSQRDAAKSILEHNIYGLDIDDRAYQLAYFAVMMKARQYNRRILNGENTCHVYAIQESNSINRAHLKYFGAGMDDIEKNAAKMQLEGLLDTLTDAKEYGSILNVESYNWDLLRRFVAAEDTDGQISMDSVGVEDTAEQLNRLIDIGETASRKYDIVVTNPPYRAVADCTERLNSFVKANYPWHEYSRILSLGLPDCISEISPGIMITVFNYRINQLLGTDGLVTFTVLMYIYNLVLMVMVGTSQGTQPLVSYYYGRSDKNAVSTFHKYARVLVSCAGVILFLIVEVFAPNITAAFIPLNTENYFNTIIALHQFSFVFLIMGHVVITSGYMVALEEPRKAFVLSISRGILFVLLSLFVCTTLLKENGIWISCTVSEIFCLGIALYDLKTQRKI